MSLQPESNSRFGLTKPFTTEEGIETFGVMKPFTFLDRDNLTPNQIFRTDPITSELAGKLDLLAQKVYGYTDLDWIFPLFNNIENPFDGYPAIGTIVEYPDPALVLPHV